jgi:hypothetical protein
MVGLVLALLGKRQKKIEHFQKTARAASDSLLLLLVGGAGGGGCLGLHGGVGLGVEVALVGHLVGVVDAAVRVGGGGRRRLPRGLGGAVRVGGRRRGAVGHGCGAVGGRGRRHRHLGGAGHHRHHGHGAAAQLLAQLQEHEAADHEQSDFADHQRFHGLDARDEDQDGHQSLHLQLQQQQDGQQQLLLKDSTS